jgi:UDP-N-acetyl-D-glucosamine dehydrogenase
MPYFCLEKITRALNSQERSVKGSNVHLVGVSYKADVGDLRESPALKLIELLREEGATVSYHDPHVAELPEHGLVSQSLDGAVDSADCVAIVTAHTGIDYDSLADRASLVVDFRNATGENGTQNGRVWKL